MLQHHTLPVAFKTVTQSCPTVFVIEQDPRMREALEVLVSKRSWQPVSFATVEDFLAHRPANGPSCVILDCDLPEARSLDLQVQLARPAMPIICTSEHGDMRLTARAMKAGAFEFLVKPFEGIMLVEAISQALERSRQALAEEHEARQLRDWYGSLTPRERDVMVLVVMGLLNKQIAYELGISEITVKVHRGHLMRKMNARSLAQLVRMGTSLGLHDHSRDAYFRSRNFQLG